MHIHEDPMGRFIYDGDLVISFLGGYTARIGILYHYGELKFSGIECRHHIENYEHSRLQTYHVLATSGDVLLWDNPTDHDRALQARLKAKYVK